MGIRDLAAELLLVLTMGSASLALCVAGCNDAPPPEPEPIKLGLLSSFTGRDEATSQALSTLRERRYWLPGLDVVHAEHGQGWVWGSGRGVVTVRFETATTGPGRVLSFAADDPDLQAVRPPPEE